MTTGASVARGVLLIGAVLLVAYAGIVVYEYREPVVLNSVVVLGIVAALLLGVRHTIGRADPTPPT